MAQLKTLTRQADRIQLERANERAHAHAHRLLEVLIDLDGPICDEHDVDIKSFYNFAEFLSQGFHCSTHADLFKRKQLRKWRVDGADYRGPKLTLTIQVYGDSGFILRPEDVQSLDSRKAFLLSTERGGRAVAYRVDRFERDEAVLSVYFRAHYGDELGGGSDDAYKQVLQLRHVRRLFVCPLCGEFAPELYLPGRCDDHSLHFGCVPCFTSLNQNTRKQYLAAKRMLRIDQGGAHGS